jgi:phosphatidylserine/phosphatidylglycerophosphate/cardiolipin synthase-like enzyme
MKKTFSILFILAMILSACDALPATNTSAPPTPPTDVPVTEAPIPLEEIPLPAAYGVRGSWFELYFTNPESPLSSQLTGGADGPLAKAIDEARLSVDVAIYSLSLNSIRDALIHAHERGVQVRMVMESDNLDRADPQKLKDAGIPIIGDRREGLMHDKFVVIDTLGEDG